MVRKDNFFEKPLLCDLTEADRGSWLTFSYKMALMAFSKRAYHHLSQLVFTIKGTICGTLTGRPGTLPWQPVTGTRNDLEELRQ